MYKKPNYSDYSLYELEEVLKRIDREAYPDRVEEVKENIKRHNRNISEKELNDIGLEEDSEIEGEENFYLVYGIGVSVIYILVHLQYIANPFSSISNGVFAPIIAVAYSLITIVAALIATWSMKSTAFLVINIISLCWFLYWAAVFKSLSIAFCGPILFIFTVGRFMACERCKEYWKSKI